MDIIKVNIYGDKNKEITGGCNLCSKKSGCSGCNSAAKTIVDAYEGLKGFLTTTDVAEKVKVNFIDINEREFESEEKEKVMDVIERGFEPPITVVDGIIRYYGGISNALVYKDIKELLS